MRNFANIPMQKNDAGAKTVGEYLQELLLRVWEEQEGFSGKRPFGNSGWDYELAAALIKAGAIEGTLDEYGDVDGVDECELYDAIEETIKSIFQEGKQ